MKRRSSTQARTRSFACGDRGRHRLAGDLVPRQPGAGRDLDKPAGQWRTVVDPQGQILGEVPGQPARPRICPMAQPLIDTVGHQVAKPFEVRPADLQLDPHRRFLDEDLGDRRGGHRASDDDGVARESDVWHKETKEKERQSAV